MPSLWRWEAKLSRYRNAETGRFIGAKGMVELRDLFVERQKAQTADLAARLIGGDLTSAEWVEAMRGVIKQTYIDQYVMARGGRAAMTQADFGRLGQMLKEQYKFLQGFERDLLNGKLTAGQIATRASMYIDSSTQAFERARGVALGAPTLPQYPGDGATVCRTSCRCHWEIQARVGGWDCYWRLGPVKTEHCESCVINASQWNPLRVEANVTGGDA